MRLKRKPKKPERKDIGAYLGDRTVDSVADAMKLKYHFHTEFKQGSKRHDDFYWFDFSTITDSDVLLDWSGYAGMSAYVLIPESPEKYAEKLDKYNVSLVTYNEWAKNKVVEIAAEEKRRDKLAVKKKRDQLLCINERIAELNAQAMALEEEDGVVEQ